MQKTRDIKTLLKLVLDRFENGHFKKTLGICFMISYMWSGKVIIGGEEKLLDDYVKKHRPKRGKFFDEYYRNNDWFWNRFDIEIRIEWLKYRISKERYSKTK